ncbi:MAG: response regulator [Candidatus Heimdallarchaeota archaeon]
MESDSDTFWDSDGEQANKPVKIRILLVNDSKTQLFLTRTQLSRLDPTFSITPALSAREALEKLQETPFDLLVSDYTVPEMDGLVLVNP